MNVVQFLKAHGAKVHVTEVLDERHSTFTADIHPRCDIVGNGFLTGAWGQPSKTRRDAVISLRNSIVGKEISFNAMDPNRVLIRVPDDLDSDVPVYVSQTRG